MLKNNVKKLIVCALVMVFIAFATNVVFATNTKEDILSRLNSELNSDNESVEDIPEGTTTVPSGLSTETKGTTTTTTTQPTTTPYTGSNSNIALVFVVIFTVSAIYAFKKVRDYKE